MSCCDQLGNDCSRYLLTDRQKETEERKEVILHTSTHPHLLPSTDPTTERKQLLEILIVEKELTGEVEGEKAQKAKHAIKLTDLVHERETMISTNNDG